MRHKDSKRKLKKKKEITETMNNKIAMKYTSSYLGFDLKKET